MTLRPFTHKPIHLAIVALFALLLPSNESNAASMLPYGDKAKNTVLQTVEGMILVGEIEESNNKSIAFKTRYGLIHIPLKKIVRINGDCFDPELGIIREHSISINRKGDVTLDYVIPVSSKPKGGTVSILVIGKILQIEDPDGNALSFLARETNNYTRCTVEVPEHRIPALFVRVFRKGDAQIEKGTIHYSYRYTPRNDQTFRLRASLPKSATGVVTSPKNAKRHNESVVWEQKLKPQETSILSLSFRLE